MRFSLLFLLSIAAPVAGAATGVLRIAYPVEYLVGAPALATLVFGLVAFALFAVCATALGSAGRPGTAAAVATVGVVVVVVANRLLVLGAPDPASALPAAALGTSLGMGTAFVLAAIAVYHRFGALFGVWTVVRAAMAGAVGWTAAYFIPHESFVGALLALMAGFACYGLALVVFGELGGKDLAAVRRVLQR
jgi:O-antigen/teichoic acid export membrane protein